MSVPTGSDSMHITMEWQRFTSCMWHTLIFNTVELNVNKTTTVCQVCKHRTFMRATYRHNALYLNET